MYKIFLSKSLGIQLRSDHGSPDPINPTRPEQVTGRVRAKFFYPKLKKNPIQPEYYTQNCGPTRARPDPIMSWAGHGPTFFDPKPKVTRPEPDPTRQMIRPRSEHS